MIALLGGLGAALCWSAAALCASAASRAIGTASTLAWVMGLGLVLIILPTWLLAPISQLTPNTVGLIALAGASNIIGLRIEYIAFRRGKVGVISAIASTQGVIAAVIAVALGAHLALWTGAVLLAVAAGVLLAAARPDPVPGSGIHAAVLAVPGALLFGVSAYATGRAGSEISVLWVLVPARLAGTAFLLAPQALRGTLRLSRRAFPLVLGAATAEVLGIVSYELGARHGIAIAAVMASQFAAFTAFGAFVVMHERMTRLQLGGLVVIAIGVGALAAGQA